MSTATETTPFIGYEKLAQLRDELKLKVHLGELDARTEWNEILEPKWQELQRKLGPIEKASAETLRQLSAAGNLLVEELFKGYERLRKAL